jgi:hypothetical protein
MGITSLTRRFRRKQPLSSSRTLSRPCVECGRTWYIARVDAEGAYNARWREGVCWTCEPEGW